ncbi:hypothetical protein B0I35DRAFT_347804 [Stachybotrys elegans]|uniref:Major facilitator superfamily transporter n=1 Tax=Stachybotrys elegans TaxID=80388 RepID=A0A8K0WVG6_9HYPO|nr:hypothetical protein B0I35DRAFT_347804 [Stachybotrys elegans]
MSRPRPRTLLLAALASLTAYYLLFTGPSTSVQIVPYIHEATTPSTQAPTPEDDANVPKTETGQIDLAAEWEIDLKDLRKWRDVDDPEDPNDIEPGYETDGKDREPGEIGRLQHEKDMRKMWRYVYKATANLPTSNLIYGNTLATLDYQDNRTEEANSYLREDPDASFPFAADKPVRFNPYPDYNSEQWKSDGHAPYVSCKGAAAELVEDLLVFKGRPHDWPAPKFGSYDLLGMDPNLCWERETRLGPYGLTEQTKKVGGETEVMNWDNVNWGDLQRRCVAKNAKRYDLTRNRKNPYLDAYPETREKAMSETTEFVPLGASASSPKIEERASIGFETNTNRSAEAAPANTGYVAEKRTAVLLRSYTGKEYTENDKQVMRALVSELTLKSGGEFEVFLLVHVKDRALRIFDDPETYQYVLQENIPPEFWGMTVLWNDEVVWNIYTELKDENERSVHTAQWLSVQKFSHDHPQFDFIWNWEMDFRFTGHHYDLLQSLDRFARKQPRRGLWERNERWYIPEYHGDYDTTFRKDIEEKYGDDTIWGPVDLPFVNPVGPKPPTERAADDDYIWGVGEDADVITVGPLFNPINSNWVIAKHVWGFTDETHHTWDLPRRTTIVTQSRVSKRLLDIMHVENKRGNHVASEMTPQTIALLHGFKAVFAPHPVFTDRDWNGKFLNKWFNPGVKGECGGRGSPMGWGRERRYQGNTWYYRAEPPNRLYNNWMGWIDTGLGGKRWEQKNGRPCLPSVMLHQIKNTKPTKKNHKTGFELVYGEMHSPAFMFGLFGGFSFTPTPWRFRVPARATQSSQTPTAPSQFRSTPRFSSSSVAKRGQNNEDIEDDDGQSEEYQDSLDDRDELSDHKGRQSPDDSIEDESEAASPQNDVNRLLDDAASPSEADMPIDDEPDPWPQSPLSERREAKRRRVDRDPLVEFSSPLGHTRTEDRASSYDHLSGDEFDTPGRAGYTADALSDLPQPVFRPPPRFKPLDADMETEGLPIAFSPQRRGAKYVPHGLAAELQGWLSDVKGWEGSDRTAPDPTLKVVVGSVKPGARMYLVRSRGDEQRKGFILAGEGRLTGLGTRADVGVGSTILLGRPVWDVELENETWTVACDWTVEL